MKLGDVLLHAVESGLDQKAVIDVCSAASKLKPRTLCNRLKVARTFPPERRHGALDWSLHLLAAYSDDPHGWLDRAEDANWNYRDMEKAINRPKTEYITKNMSAWVVGLHGRYLTLEIIDVLPSVEPEMHVLVTLESVPDEPDEEVQALAPETL